jgi:hypothetical protein
MYLESLQELLESTGLEDAHAYPNALPRRGKIDAIGLSKADTQDCSIDKGGSCYALNCVNLKT